MTDTEKEHKEYAGLIDGVSISFRHIGGRITWML